MRRLRIALVVALSILGGVTFALALAAFLLVRTDRGNEWVRQRIMAQLEGALGPNGSALLGRLNLSPLGSASVDTLELRDAAGALVFASGPINARFALAPLLDREVRLYEVVVRRPQIHLAQRPDSGWNIGALFSSADTTTAVAAPEGPSKPWTMTMDSLELAHGLVTVARLDSLPSLPLRRTQYAGIEVVLGRSRFAMGSREGAVLIHRLAADIESPPLLLRHAEGRVALWRDSVRVDFPAVRLRDTQGSLSGGIGWGVPDADARLALVLKVDSAAFSDLTWITDFIPDSGRGRAVVSIINGPERGITRYVIDSLDATGTDSRLGGRFLVDVGPALAIRDLDLSMTPLDFRFLHEILRDSIPGAPWDGALRGRLVARGGTLDAWRIDSSAIEYEDRRIGGARSRLAVSGTIDFLAEALSLEPLDILFDSLDVRTAGAILSRADSLDGFLRGRVSLSGPIDDFRFDGVDVILTDGALPMSHFRGAGRVAMDTSTTWLEAQLIIDSASVASIGKAITPTALRGRVSGSLSAAARGDSLALELALEGEDAFFALSGTTSTDSARLVFKGTATMETFDLRRFLPRSNLPDHQLTARATSGLDGNWSGPSGPLEIIIDSTSEVAGLTLRNGRASLVLEPGGARIDTLGVESTLGRISAKGHLSRDPARRDSVRFLAFVDSVTLLGGFMSDSLIGAIKDSLGGKLRAEGTVFGSFDTLRVAARWSGTDLRAGGTSVDSIAGALQLAGIPRAPVGRSDFTARGVTAAGIPLTSLALQATFRDDQSIDARAQLVAGDTLRATATADLRFNGDTTRLRLDSLVAVTNEATWVLEAPARLTDDGRRLVTDTVRLRSESGGAELAFAITMDTAGPVSAFAHVARIPLEHARFTALVPAGVRGMVSADATLSGTKLAPTMNLAITVDSGAVESQLMPRIEFKGDYADRRFDVDLRARSAEREEFALTGTLPLDLRFRSLTRSERLRKDEEMYLRFVASGTSVAGLRPFIPGIAGLTGAFDADLLVGGHWGDYQPRGIFLLRDGAFAVPSLRTSFQDLLMDVSLAPDSVILHRVRLADVSARGDTAALEGALFHTDDGWHADIRSMARSLQVIDNPRVAEANVSWQLQLRGPLDSLLLRGNVTVPTANAFIASQRDVLPLDEDIAAAEARRKYMPAIDQLVIQLGNEVRLRSPDVNVQLTGGLAVSGDLESPFLRGEVIATRGTYRLNLGLLQRTFQVDSGVVRLNGVMRPDGTSDNPPLLDIYASYLVRQVDREDVRIAARITGTTQAPRVTLSSSNLGSTASETDIISYLLFGAPSYALNQQNSSAVRTATAALVPSLGGAVEKALGGQIPWITDLQVTTVAGESPSDFSLNSFEGLLNSFALTAGKQLGPDSYMSLSTGTCRGESPAAQSLPVWFGISAEYRPVEKLSALMSVSPGNSPCTRVGRPNQIYQFGLDLYRDWRW
ncbi:MAG: translocation/assembly module TamB domain-containing protein [Gemmatimonadaceae bacterium]